MKLTKRVLYNTARPVLFRYPWQNRDLGQRMVEFMRRHAGIGLSAPQIGLSQRLFVMGIGDRVWHCFNPSIVTVGPETVEMTEGCLSFPNKSCTLTRPREILALYHTAEGEPVTETMDGLIARCYQHELDHLDGVTIFQRTRPHDAEQS